jgi:ribosomal protein L31E
MQNRLITINIRKYLSTQPRTKRANKAVKLLRSQVSRLARVKPENIRFSQAFNSLVFKRYSRVLTPIKLNVSIDNERATVTPFVEKAAKKEEVGTAKEAAGGKATKQLAEKKK